ncbi:MAG: adenylate kinase family protein [Candidatus Aenigmarchaeota archaeon]|nr:adenylate kinase family protein [Candidatus Aenigmarchaeota archaeon]
MRIAITGTPGVGKTLLSKKLAKMIKYDVIELNKEIKKNKLYDSYDKKRKCLVVDIKKVDRYLKKIKLKNMIIDSHLSHYLKNNDIVIVLRCEPKMLEKRLRKKRWNKEKVRENLEAEYINLIIWEARQSNKNVYDVDTTKGKPLNTLKQIINGKGKKYKKQINWM